jgi:hypothetical protein
MKPKALNLEMVLLLLLFFLFEEDFSTLLPSLFGVFLDARSAKDFFVVLETFESLLSEPVSTVVVLFDSLDLGMFGLRSVVVVVSFLFLIFFTTHKKTRHMKNHANRQKKKQ